MDCTSNNEIIEWLKENLDNERFEHSIGVSETAVELAKKFGQDEKKACLAGLLHDCAKCVPKEELEKIIKEKLQVDECELISSKTYHAPVGAYFAKTKFGVKDEEILSAIRWHTVGKVGMSDFEKIIFIADKIEPYTRPKEFVNHIKPYLDEENGLDKAMLASFKLTIKSLVDRELKICMNTIIIYNELLKQYE